MNLAYHLCYISQVVIFGDFYVLYLPGMIKPLYTKGLGGVFVLY